MMCAKITKTMTIMIWSTSICPIMYVLKLYALNLSIILVFSNSFLPCCNGVLQLSLDDFRKIVVRCDMIKGSEDAA